jgi:hypothetical protein
MKDDLNDEVFNGTPKTLIPFNGVLNWDEVSKSNDKLEGDHATHFKSWIERPIAQSLIWKMFICKGYNRRGADDVSVIYNGWK